MSRELRRWAPLLAVGAVLAAAALAAALATPRVGRVPPPVGEGAAPAAGAATVSASASQPSEAIRPGSPIVINIPAWFNTGLTIVVGVLAAVFVAAALWYVLRDSLYVRTRPITVDAGGPAQPAAGVREVTEAVEESMIRLAGEEDARTAVIACWVRLEQVAAAAGTPRQPGDSPADLVHRLLAGHRVSRPLLDQLAGLYRAARYATHAVDGSMRAQALAAFGQLRDELAWYAPAERTAGAGADLGGPGPDLGGPGPDLGGPAPVAPRVRPELPR